jgi:tRNA A-37 threonylcarbamoyl transferase component Bud32
MALRIVANRPDPAVVTLPWATPLKKWGDEHVVPLPRGLSRHIVRIVRLRDQIYAVKETQEEMAMREYRLLRDLQRLGLPAVVPQAVISGRVDKKGRDLPSALVTQHLRFSLPYRSLFAHGVTAEDLPSLVDAMVVLLVRLHLAGFYWGDVSLSNVLFRRDAGAFTAYLVDAETGELRAALSDRMRDYDLTVGTENIFAELLDLQASHEAYAGMEAEVVVDMLEERYRCLWNQLTGEERFTAREMWRIEQRIEQLNDLGFDVEELDIVTDFDGDQVILQPRVVELGHHRRELQSLTGLLVEDNQARRLLNDIAAYTATFDLGREDRLLVASRWLTYIYEPIMAMIPAEARGKLEPAEIFHEVLVHRWYLSEQRGREVDIFETARDYIANVLTRKPEEAVAPPIAVAPGLEDDLEDDLEDAGLLVDSDLLD